MKNTCIIIVGPTAVGKTAVALKIAKHFGTEIISADSRQCYKELNIGVAKPSQEELSEITHHFIGSHSIQDDLNTAIFEQYALQTVNEIFLRTRVAVIAGGTGLYIKAFSEGIDDIPNALSTIREKIVYAYGQNGIEWLQSEVKKEDPLFFSTGEIHNPRRLMRALEVKLSTGISIVEFQTKQKKNRDFDIIKIGLELPRELLYRNINDRVDIMMNDGLLSEAESLYEFRELNALQTVGYRELFQHFAGDISLEKAVSLIKQNTRHYAKRQMTWFKKDQTIEWIDIDKKDSFKKIMDRLKF